MRFKLLIFLFAIISNSIYANGNYIKGYMTLCNGDTIAGYLLNQNSLNASKFCVFKKNLDDKPKNYSATDICGYRYLHDKYYVSKEITINKNDKKVVFMEFLINGISDIYYYKDKNGDHYFIEKDKIGLIELIEKKQTFNDVEIITSKYKGELKRAMADCPDINAEIERTSLNHISLINLAKIYHDRVCTSESCIIYERTNLSAKFKFGIILGITKNNYNFGNRLLGSNEVGYQFGIGMKIENILFSNERFNLDVKLLLDKNSKFTMSPYSDYYYNYKVSYNGIDYDLNSQNAYNTTPSLAVNLNIIGLKIPVMINYCYPFKNSSLNVGVGLSDKIIIYCNKQYIDYAFYNQYGKSINTFLIGGIVNIGFDRNLKKEQKIGINLGYDYLVVPTALNAYLRLRESQFSLQLIYSF